MTDTNRTAWFSHDVLPERPGVYEVRNKVADFIRYCYWSGDAWAFYTYDTPKKAATQAIDIVSPALAPWWEWRGLSNPFLPA